MPDPASIVAACATLARPGGTRRLRHAQPQSEVLPVRDPRRRVRAAAAAARHARLGEVHAARRSSRAFARRAGLDLAAMTGMTYNPLTRRYRLEDATRRSTTSRPSASPRMPADGAPRGRCRSPRSCSTSTARLPTPPATSRSALNRVRADRGPAAGAGGRPARARIVRRARPAARRHGHHAGGHATTASCAKRSSRTTRPASPRRRRCSTASRRCSTRIEARGMRWGIVTNKHARFTAARRQRRWRSRSAPRVVVSGDTTPHAKPHPAPLLHAAQRRCGSRRRAACTSATTCATSTRAAPPGMATIVAGLRLHGHRRRSAARWPATGWIAGPLDLLRLAALRAAAERVSRAGARR